MSLNRRKINNFIIFLCLLMISVLMLLEKYRKAAPEEANPLFSNEFPLVQLELMDHWMHKGKNQWICSEKILNCHQWVQAWQEIQISALNFEPELSSKPQVLSMEINNIPTTQTWFYFDKEGLLKSPTQHWYQVPPRLREGLIPIISIAH